MRTKVTPSNVSKQIPYRFDRILRNFYGTTERTSVEESSDKMLILPDSRDMYKSFGT